METGNSKANFSKAALTYNCKDRMAVRMLEILNLCPQFISAHFPLSMLDFSKFKRETYHFTSTIKIVNIGKPERGEFVNL